MAMSMIDCETVMRRICAERGLTTFLDYASDSLIISDGTSRTTIARSEVLDAEDPKEFIRFVVSRIKAMMQGSEMKRQLEALRLQTAPSPMVFYSTSSISMPVLSDEPLGETFSYSIPAYSAPYVGANWPIQFAEEPKPKKQKKPKPAMLPEPGRRRINFEDDK